jgi:hypothetical protein
LTFHVLNTNDREGTKHPEETPRPAASVRGSCVGFGVPS